jgi:hypothetical protein
MPAFTVPDNLPPLHSKSVDTLSVMYLQSLGLDIGTPLRVNADGNCLFNSISTFIYGHEDKARELRVKTCIQMCNNMDRYLTSPDAGNILLQSPTFEDDCRDCSIDSAWSSAWSIMALADVIGHFIKTHYPPMYGKGHLAYHTLNTTYSPCGQTLNGE